MYQSMRNDNGDFRILAINPGSSSTKFAVFDDQETIMVKNLEHSFNELKQFSTIADQYVFRKNLILNALNEGHINLDTLDAIVARGGMIHPLEGGTYRISPKMVGHLKNGIQGQHASNLAGIIAFDLAQELGIPAFTVDPVVVNELQPIAQVTGLKEVKRNCIFHALNCKAVARKVAQEINKDYLNVNFVIAHLGTGISIGVSKNGRIIDVTNPFSSGPFSPERCGGLPSEELVKMCYSGIYTYEQMIDKLYKKGGLFSYFGTKDVREVEKMAKAGNQEAKLVLEAMVYKIAKGIGEMAVVVEGKVERIVLTGGMAKSEYIVSEIIRYVEWIAPIVIVPGENELPALVNGALRVLKGEEDVKEYLPEADPKTGE